MVGAMQLKDVLCNIDIIDVDETHGSHFHCDRPKPANRELEPLIPLARISSMAGWEPTN